MANQFREEKDLRADADKELERTFPFQEFLDVMVRPVAAGESELDRLLAFVRALHGPGPLEDDFSVVKFEF